MDAQEFASAIMKSSDETRTAEPNLSVLQKKTHEFQGELYELDQNIKDLISLIGPALAPHDDPHTGEDTEPSPELSEVAMWVHNQTRFVAELNQVLRSVRRRVEL